MYMDATPLLLYYVIVNIALVRDTKNLYNLLMLKPQLYK